VYSGIDRGIILPKKISLNKNTPGKKCNTKIYLKLDIEEIFHPKMKIMSSF